MILPNLKSPHFYTLSEIESALALDSVQKMHPLTYERLRGAHHILLHYLEDRDKELLAHRQAREVSDAKAWVAERVAQRERAIEKSVNNFYRPVKFINPDKVEGIVEGDL